MTTLETLAVVLAVYAVVFLAHHATRALDRTAHRGRPGTNRGGSKIGMTQPIG